jgi:hypothetical protein
VGSRGLHGARLVLGERGPNLAGEQLWQISKLYQMCRPVLPLPLRCNAGRDDRQNSCQCRDRSDVYRRPNHVSKPCKVMGCDTARRIG